MALKIVVLVKQVPDTKRIIADAMKEDGTVNRQALPAIFNPEDLNALELALSIKDQRAAELSVLTMGPPAAASVLRDTLFRGADRVFLITDRKFAGADTLATSYTLMKTIEKICPDFDLIVCGRQAIDGDTAQVGPQIAEKLKVPQVSYVEAIENIEDGHLIVKRMIQNGAEWVRSRMPALLTVVDSANTPRPPKAKLIMKYKYASCELELDELIGKFPEFKDKDELRQYLVQKDLYIPVITADDLDIDPERIGMNGSPTKVKKIDRVVLAGGALKLFENTDQSLQEMIHELVEDYIIS
ncbi:electron transfer flavoprotein subunit beta/FixA family protein [candidate division KSB1 bacterium]|nr:electron transfer flavoprotein subunit beta/FixA family protein [candidate division KSB1 bacterium]